MRFSTASIAMFGTMLIGVTLATPIAGAGERLPANKAVTEGLEDLGLNRVEAVKVKQGINAVIDQFDGRDDDKARNALDQVLRKTLSKDDIAKTDAIITKVVDKADKIFSRSFQFEAFDVIPPAKIPDKLQVEEIPRTKEELAIIEKAMSAEQVASDKAVEDRRAELAVARAEEKRSREEKTRLADIALAKMTPNRHAPEETVVVEKVIPTIVPAEKVAADKLAAEKATAEKVAADKLVAEKVAAEKIAADKLAAEKKDGALATNYMKLALHHSKKPDNCHCLHLFEHAVAYETKTSTPVEKAEMGIWALSNKHCIEHCVTPMTKFFNTFLGHHV